MTVKELRKVAKDLNVKNWWNLKKEELINAIHELQNEPESTETNKSSKLSDTTKSVPELILREYAASVRIPETRDIAAVFGSAVSRTDFYLDLKEKGYRVRFITKPNKFEEELKLYDIRHARNKKMKNEKYAADKEKAKALGLSVIEYRKAMREHE